ncbi:MAG TPA: hypothetical protein VEV84_06195 [Pyrinomonadaceae bacterium]|nr:hypothetical protein [Pyrinomonadaceae bacterium]
MKLTRGLLSLLLVFSLGFISFITLPTRHVIAQEANTALKRGYRTGYSDGYMAGYRDVLDNKTRDFTKHPDYNSADRAYSKDYGPIEDYRDGYQQGFEVGYAAGFDKKDFDSNVPEQLMIRGNTQSAAAAPNNTAAPPAATTPATTTVPPPADTSSTAAQPATNAADQTATTTTPATDSQPAANNTNQTVSYRSDASVIAIPKDTELILELNDPLSTEKSKPGDKFTAKVVSPTELSGAIVEGRVNKITRPGRLKRRSEISLSFDRIVLGENRWGNFSGTLTEVLPVRGDNVRRVDDEGTAVGRSSVKEDSIKLGAATGTGATIGAVTGGPVGAAVGAGVGAAFGVGAVVIERGKEIRLNANQQLKVKSGYDIQIR